MVCISVFDLEARISMRQASSVPAPCDQYIKMDVLKQYTTIQGELDNFTDFEM